MTGPDYIIIGAMKCGTSTLAAQLGGQEGVFMTTPKEPNYFSDDDVFTLGQDWYAGLFADAAVNDIKGEASTHYTKLPTYPDTVSRMQAVVPQPRLVYMIRDPMVRLVSHYIHAWSEAETAQPLEQALSDMPNLVDYGCYGMQIAPFVQAFGAKAILLTSLERLKSDPEAELARIARHIGHVGPTAWQEEAATQNVSSERMRKLPLQGLLIDNPVARALRRTLVPKSLRAAVRQTRQMTDRPSIPSSHRAALEARFLEDRAQLAAIFPDDPSLMLAYPFAV